ncbi:hypothetical protein Skr01_59140 [Sphaerisporangium krabiense]|nr:hypothetical protein Skr01_59140 [Sphaerisporangium krabiense]
MMTSAKAWRPPAAAARAPRADPAPEPLRTRRRERVEPAGRLIVPAFGERSIALFCRRVRIGFEVW